VGTGFENKEEKMNCQDCGGRLEKIITNLPFKIRHNSIIIIKELPVLQCKVCHQYLLEDKVMGKVDRIMKGINDTVEVEILSYAV